MEEKDENGNYLSTCVRKINISVSAFCIYCNKPLVYGNTGKKDLLKDATKLTEDLSSKMDYLFTTLLPLHWRKPTSGSSSDISACTPLARKCAMPCGVAENANTTVTRSSLKESISRPIVGVSDCKHHLETCILSFIAENSILLSMFPKNNSVFV